MNLLMYGPPGTGKTEFVKYLGKELDRKVLVMKGSDILLVQSRENAHASWEIAQVNELLQQMETFDGVMIAALREESLLKHDGGKSAKIGFGD